MQATLALALALRGGAQTFLTHFTGGTLEDERYVVERFRSYADGRIEPAGAGGKPQSGRRRPRPEVATRKAVEKMRPARDEIIIATGLRLRHCSVQYWGTWAMGILVERRQKG